MTRLAQSSSLDSSTDAMLVAEQEMVEDDKKRDLELERVRYFYYDCSAVLRLYLVVQLYLRQGECYGLTHMISAVSDRQITWCIVVIFTIRQGAAWTSTLTTKHPQKESPRRKPREIINHEWFYPAEKARLRLFVVYLAPDMHFTIFGTGSILLIALLHSHQTTTYTIFYFRL